MRYTAEQYNQKYQTLTPDLQAYIGSEDVDGTLADIARNNKLSLEQRKNLAAEVAYVLIGLEPKGSFAQNLKQYLGLDDVTAQAIFAEINQDIFVPAEALGMPTVITPILTSGNQYDSITAEQLAQLALTETPETLKKIGEYIRNYPKTHDGKVHPAYNYLMTSPSQGIF